VKWRAIHELLTAHVDVDRRPAEPKLPADSDWWLYIAENGYGELRRKWKATVEWAAANGLEPLAKLAPEDKFYVLKIVLSRKGWDSTYGGGASPILDGQLISLPIPETPGYKGNIHFSDILAPRTRFKNLGEVVNALRKNDQLAHMDPDLERARRPREEGWRGLFGQDGGDQSGAQIGLSTLGVGNGDLFLFYGLFRQAEYVDGQLRYRPKATAPEKNVIWGWLTVGEIVEHTDNRRRPNPNAVQWLKANSWARYHSHFHYRFGPKANNAVYVAANKVFGEFDGWGIFESDDRNAPKRCLTDLDLHVEEVKSSSWRLPSLFASRTDDTGQTRYSLSRNEADRRWTEAGDSVLLETKIPGQEYVLDTEYFPEAIEWARAILEGGQGQST